MVETEAEVSVKATADASARELGILDSTNEGAEVLSPCLTNDRRRAHGDDGINPRQTSSGPPRPDPL